MRNEAEDTLTQDLTAAWEAAEAAESGEEAPEATVAAVAEPPVGETLETSPEASEAPETPPEEPLAAAEAPETPPTDDKAPAGLPPEAREAWADTPPAMRAAIAKREADFSAGIQRYAENAKRAEAMDQAFAPYQQLFALNGGVQNFMPGFLQTAAALQMGTPQQRAGTLVNMIKQFDIDVPMVADILGGGEGKAAPDTQLNQLLDQKLAPVQQFMQQMQQNQQEASQQQVASDIQAFAANPKNEFFNDVREDMADLMDMASNRGREMSMQEAYDKACQMHPQISRILADRTAAGSAQQKMAAAASISGTPSGEGPGVSQPTTMRGALEQAWASVSDNDAGRV